MRFDFHPCNLHYRFLMLAIGLLSFNCPALSASFELSVENNENSDQKTVYRLSDTKAVKIQRKELGNWKCSASAHGAVSGKNEQPKSAGIVCRLNEDDSVSTSLVCVDDKPNLTMLYLTTKAGSLNFYITCNGANTP